MDEDPQKPAFHVAVPIGGIMLSRMESVAIAVEKVEWMAGERTKTMTKIV